MGKINKKQAMALAVLAVGTVAGATQALADIADQSRGRDVALLVAEGCKLYAHKRGCVITYRVAGYAHDGRDVERCVARANRLVANVSGGYQHDGFDPVADANSWDPTPGMPNWSRS